MVHQARAIHAQTGRHGLASPNAKNLKQERAWSTKLPRFILTHYRALFLGFTGLSTRVDNPVDNWRSEGSQNRRILPPLRAFHGQTYVVFHMSADSRKAPPNRKKQPVDKCITPCMKTAGVDPHCANLTALTTASEVCRTAAFA